LSPLLAKDIRLKALNYLVNLRKITLKKMNIDYKIYERADVDKIDNQHNEIFINATPIDIESKRNKIIDLRPHTEHGKIVAKFQAIDQFKLYTGIDYEES
jgi:shikimate 5-dehydrogenase